MGVTLRWCEGKTMVLRAGPEHHSYGDPYTVSGTVELNPHDPEAASVLGFSSAGFLLEDWAEFRRQLRQIGIRRLSIERIRAGRRTQHEWRI